MAKLKNLKSLRELATENSESQVVWSDDAGDLKKKKNKTDCENSVDESKLLLELRRLTSGKGRAVIEIKGLPENKNWSKKMAKILKKKLGVGGAFKDDFIEVHTAELERVALLFDQMNIKWKKTGG